MSANLLNNRTRRPTHPGELLREDVLPAAGISQLELARRMGVSRRTVYNRIREGRLRTVRTRCGSQRVLVDSMESLLREMVQKAKQRVKGRGAGV